MVPDNIKAAHDLRKVLKKPFQSNFRVVAILSCIDNEGNTKYITGTNIESSFIGGSICAERAALCKLHESLDVREVASIVIVSDSENPISPGVLCREFLSTQIDGNVPIFMSGTRDENAVIKSSVSELYPYPCIYGRTNRNDINAFVSKFSQYSQKFEKIKVDMKLDKRIVEAYDTALMETAKDVSCVHHMCYGCTVAFDDGSSVSAYQLKTAEYGSTLDPVTQLIWSMLQKNYCGIRVHVIIQVDQFGNCHAPFASGRALLTEHGFGYVDCLVHNIAGELHFVKAEQLVPTIACYVSEEDININDTKRNEKTTCTC